MDHLWGSLCPDEFKSVRFVSRRLATEDDVQSGAAVFYLQAPENPKTTAEPYPLNLPACAMHKEGEQETPVVIIQAEIADGRVIVGARPLKGGNLVCLLSECELVEHSNPRFAESQPSRQPE